LLEAADVPYMEQVETTIRPDDCFPLFPPPRAAGQELFQLEDFAAAGLALRGTTIHG
jgi:hypothetical protein